MRNKKGRKDPLKGVYISLLTSKGQSGKAVYEALTKTGCQLYHENELSQLIKSCNKKPADILCLEVDFCEELAAKKEENTPGIENIGAGVVVVLAKDNQADEAVEWSQTLKGYYVSTPVSSEEICVLLERSLDSRLLQERLDRYEKKEASLERFGPVVAKSADMKDVIRVASILATRDDNLLFVGAVGTGKELLARTIHEQSSRRYGPFYTINCRTFSNEDLAVEIFGKGEPGSPEAGDEKCLLELCDGGTLFLEEIGVITPNVQGKLQRFLEDKSYTRVNSRTIYHSDVRIFASTTSNLNESVAKGEFSEALYFYLNRFTLNVPALKNRVEDIPVLTSEFLTRIAATKNEQPLRISEDALKYLVEYNWPGNVRELENVLDYAALLATEGAIEPRQLPRQFHDEVGSIFVGNNPDELPPMSEIERQYILRVMEACKGNKVRAAQILDVNRATLHRKLGIYEQQKKMKIN